MMEWFLTDGNIMYLYLIMIVVTAIFLVLALLISIDAFDYSLKFETRRSLSLVCLAVSVTMFFTIVFIDDQIVEEHVTEGDWVQIYSNNQNADISIYFSPTSYIKAGEELDDYQRSTLKALYSRNEVKDVAVAASKDGAEERRVVKLDGRNISIPLDKDYSMKITKIEYQKIVGQRKTLFGHHGNVTSSTVDGQIRITVEEEKSDQSLKELFDSKKQ